jgi:hypothetical protein
MTATELIDEVFEISLQTDEYKKLLEMVENLKNHDVNEEVIKELLNTVENDLILQRRIDKLEEKIEKLINK